MDVLEEEVQRDLDITESLVNFGAATIGDVEASLRGALSYVNSIDPADIVASANIVIIRGELNGELDLVARLPDSAPEPPNQWPRQRRAIERAYSFATSNFEEISRAAADAKARADAANKVLDQISSAAKGVGSGLEGILSLVIVLVVVLVIAQFAGRRTA